MAMVMMIPVVLIKMVRVMINGMLSRISLLMAVVMDDLKRGNSAKYIMTGINHWLTKLCSTYNCALRLRKLKLFQATRIQGTMPRAQF